MFLNPAIDMEGKPLHSLRITQVPPLPGRPPYSTAAAMACELNCRR